MWIFVFAVVTLLSYLTYTRIWKPHRYWEERGVKHTNSWPIFGDFAPAVFKKKSFSEIVLDIYGKCPGERYFGVNQFLTPTLIVRDLELINRITVKDFDHFEDHKTVTPPDVDPMFGRALFSLTGQEWREMRAVLSPAFTSAKMKAMFHFMSKCSESFVQHFLKNGNQETVMEMKETFTKYTNDVIASTAFGITCDSLKNPNNEFYVNGRETTNFGFVQSIIFFANGLCPSIIKAFKIPFVPTKNANFYRRIVKETLDAREKQNIIRPDMIHLLMEARKGRLEHENGVKDVGDTGFAIVNESSIGRQKIKQELTDDDITAQAVVFILGGLDTSAVLMSFLAYELAVNPDVQKKLQLEIDAASKKSNGEITYEVLLGIKYLDMAISETLRKWPPALFLDRLCVKETIIEPIRPDEEPLVLETNTVVWIPAIGFHKDPKYFPNPDRFDPERFSDENKGNIVSGTYMPFGDGPRNCIGSRFALLETKILFFHLLSKFDIVVVERTQIPLKLSKSQFFINAEEGFWLGFKKRN